MQIHDASDDPSPSGAPSPAPSLPPLNRPSGPLGQRGYSREPSRIQGFPYKVPDPGLRPPEIHQGYVQRCRRSPSFLGAQPLEKKEIRQASFSTWEQGSPSEGSSLPSPPPGFPAPIPPPAPAPGPQRGGGAPEPERRSVPCFTSRSQRNVCRSDMFQLILEERKFLQLERAEIWGQGAGARSRLPAS